MFIELELTEEIPRRLRARALCDSLALLMLIYLLLLTLHWVGERSMFSIWRLNSLDEDPSLRAESSRDGLSRMAMGRTVYVAGISAYELVICLS